MSMKDDGVITLDFLVGFTIFTIAFIFVATMIPHTLFSVHSSRIDCDAVAYRTGVILTEDPGMPASPAVPVWEQQSDPANIIRMGLSVDRSRPHILSITKVERFFDDEFFRYPDDYQRALIFGEYPYLFTITLAMLDDDTIWSVGSSPPDSFGIIRRVVMVKGESVLVIDEDMITGSVQGNCTPDLLIVNIPCEVLLDRSVDPAFRIDPRTDRLRIEIQQYSGFLNVTGPARIKDIRQSGIVIPYTSYDLNITKESLTFTLIPVQYPPWDRADTISVTFAFTDPDDPPTDPVVAAVVYDYTNATIPPLKRGILEVAVW